MIPSLFHRARAALRMVAVSCVLVSAFPATAQLRIEVSGVGLTQLPIAIAPFRGQDGVPQKISAIVQADLERSGQFRGTDVVLGAMDELSRPELTAWRQKGADSLVAGSVTPLADGRFDVRFRLWDLTRGQDLGGQSYAVAPGDLRQSAKSLDLAWTRLRTNVSPQSSGCLIATTTQPIGADIGGMPFF